VSVIIPAHNAEAFIGDTIESVLAQTRLPAEIIVVDDGSTDGTAATIQRFGSRIRLLRQENRGVTNARNAGAAAARGEWLAFLDADDLWLPTKLERQLEVAARSQAVLIYTDRFNIGTRGNLPEVQSSIQRLYEGDVFVPLLLEGNHIPISSALLRTDIFRDLGGFHFEDWQGAEDWELWIRVAERLPVAACREPLVSYRFHGTMMSSDPKKMQRARLMAIDSALELPRSKAMGVFFRRRVRAAAANMNGEDAARRHAFRLAIAEYARAIALWPICPDPYKNILRLLLRRV
jgi:glycosyltransferase involved in cell wall biosynthesis